jgi:hypothetical protein
VTRSEFERLLRKATAAAINFARDLVLDSLPNDSQYRVVLNQSYDWKVEEGDLTFPEDAGITRSGLSVEEVVEILYRDGRCPVWIDVSVEAVAGLTTSIRLLCAGRYTNDEARMYYVTRKMGPFGIKSPALPVGYREGQKFALPTL